MSCQAFHLVSYRLESFLDSQIPSLQNTITAFYSKNVSPKNFATFMAFAVQMKAGQLIVATKSKMGSLIAGQPQNASRLAPRFLVRVLEVNRKELRAKAFNNPRINQNTFKLASYQWSKAVHSCVNKNKDGMNKRLFKDLTSEDVLPAISPSVALPLLMFEKHFHGNQDEYTSLQKRCVTSIIANWEVFKQGFPSMGEMTAALQSLPSEVLAAILITSRRANF